MQTQLNGTLSFSVTYILYIIVTQRIIMIVLFNTIFLPLCKQKLYIIAIFCIGSSSVLLVLQYFYQFFKEITLDIVILSLSYIP